MENQIHLLLIYYLFIYFYSYFFWGGGGALIAISKFNFDIISQSLFEQGQNTSLYIIYF